MITFLKPPEFPFIAFSQKNEIVERLIEIINVHEHNLNVYKDENERLKGIIAELQNAPKKPKIKPSSIEKPSSQKKPRPNETKESKKDRLAIHEQRILKPQEIPLGSVFKGYRTYLVQDIILSPHNTLFKLERWQSPDGHYLSVPLPQEYDGYHFGPQLRVFILQQYYQARVTRPKLLQELHDWGIEISAGELNAILLDYTPSMEKELEDVIKSAFEKSSYIQTDDTGARHKGKNHVCTHIGNHLFTYLHTGTSKSRLHFLELLNREGSYQTNEACRDYLRQHGSLKLIQVVNHEREYNKLELEKFLSEEQNLGPNQLRTLREALIVGSLAERRRDIIILSDGAPQYKVLNHASCWVHAMRLLEKERPLRGEKAEEILAKLRFLYHNLKRYKERPSVLFKKRLSAYFDQICDLRVGSKAFDSALERFFLNKQDLLKVLDNSEIPLHNNLSENDLREYVVRRKISGGTRSDMGKKSRDVFCSLLKTCMKLEVRFWQFLIKKILNPSSLSLGKIILIKSDAKALG